jgi:transcriptional regulator with XRE-family HTH domain
MGRPARAGRLRKAPRRTKITAEQFRDARVFGGFTRERAAEFLGVSLRTVGQWETGKARPAYAAFRLLRVYQHGDIIDPAWEGFRIIRGQIVSPEGRSFGAHDLTWWGLTVARSREFSSLLAEAQQWRAIREAWKHNRQTDQPQAMTDGFCSTGLVPSKTTRTSEAGNNPENGDLEPFRPDCNGADIGPEWGHTGPVIPTHHDHPQAELATADGSIRSRTDRSRGAAHLGELVRPASTGKPRRVHQRATAQARGQAVAGASAFPRPCDNSPSAGLAYRSDSDGCTARAASFGGPKSRTQPAVSVRKRQAIQALPRRRVIAGGAA